MCVFDRDTHLRRKREIKDFSGMGFARRKSS